MGGAVGALLLAWIVNSANSLPAAVLVNVAVATAAVVVGSVARGLKWRTLIGPYNIDPGAVVYWSRGDYAKLVENAESAAEIDIIGISLQYYIEYIRDYGGDFTRKVGRTRILLPGVREICDGRDQAQGTQIGSLWQSLEYSIEALDQVHNAYPSAIATRFYSVQPYFAMTRIDDDIWVSPYITGFGRSSPVIAVSRQRSPELFKTFSEHFENIWIRSNSDLPKFRKTTRPRKRASGSTDASGPGAGTG